MKELGMLKKVPLREIWVHEAQSFTKWLAEEKNLGLLSETLELDLTLVQTEYSVGRFNVDILAEQTSGGGRVVIENQFGHTDHDHLGKTITYASGVDATVIIWVVEHTREEHKRAVDWLNEHTDEGLNFFIVQIEALQIGNSLPAPNFNIVSQPNDWAKAVKQSAAASAVSDTKLRQLEFWETFKEFAQARKTGLSLRKPRAQHWYDVSSGASNWHISLTLNSFTHLMGCEVYIPQDKAQFKKFEEHKEQIEEHLGQDLEWMELPDKKASRIKQSWPYDLSDTEKWPEYFEWLIYRAESFKKTFGSLKQR